MKEKKLIAIDISGSTDKYCMEEKSVRISDRKQCHWLFGFSDKTDHVAYKCLLFDEFLTTIKDNCIRYPKCKKAEKLLNENFKNISK
jgi:hypothetical protein